ncbi:SPPL2B [Lepeophtheirus salmonis]|uniref:SPPL2B n=1 Tax=Lepeophtheirus salmonis TaxID=72036 RepID=A0A7R8CEW7_LEPSM|nr:SPPL2B [Lepeophtheirus salmonis]CAF2756063.1 SPPL2B [Lepeophtheirus salmonis]
MPTSTSLTSSLTLFSSFSFSPVTVLNVVPILFHTKPTRPPANSLPSFPLLSHWWIHTLAAAFYIDSLLSLSLSPFGSSKGFSHCQDIVTVSIRIRKILEEDEWEKLKSYDYCLRHILEDKTAPFKQCSYNIKSQKRCLRPAPRADKKDGYCAEHARKTQMNRHKLLAKKGHLELYTRCLEDLRHYEGSEALDACSPPKVIRWDGMGEEVKKEEAVKEMNPHELLSKVRHVSCVVEGGEEVSEEEEDVRVDQAWKGDGDSDAESMDSDLDNPLRHAGIYAAEEVVRIMRDKLICLQKNYIDQFQRLQYLLREERRRYKHAQGWVKTLYLPLRSQVLFRRCGFITPADDEPCETPIPNTFDESTCVYHAYLPSLYFKQESLNCNHTNSRKEQSVPSIKVKVEPISKQEEDIKPDNLVNHIVVGDKNTNGPIIPQEILEMYVQKKELWSGCCTLRHKLKMKDHWSLVASILCVLAFASSVDSKLETRLGILETSGGDYYCISYIPSLSKIPSKSDSQTFQISSLINFTHVDTCNPNDESVVTDSKNKIPFISGNNDLGNCSIAERAKNLQDSGALGILSDGTVHGEFTPNQFKITIPVISAMKNDIYKLSTTESSESTFRIYHLDHSFLFDPAILALFLMATGTVLLGSFLSGYFSKNKRKGFVSGESGDHTAAQSQTLQPQSITNIQDEDASVSITPLKVIIYVIFMSCFLVTIYFFSSYIIYGLIGLYILLSITSTYSIFEPLVMCSYSKCSGLPTCFFPKWKLWFIYRKEPWIWIIQDFLGILICLLLMRDVRLPSLKICTLLLSLLLFYDIFFVFITPYFTKDGESVMVDVALGGDSGETFPIVLIVPRMLSLKKICYSNVMMLGLGDIALPGLLVSYCYSFDVHMEKPCKIYWICANIGYIIGLIITDVSLLLSGAAQPALLYLVPCTLVPTFLVALCRGEFKTIWNGGPFPSLELNHS